MTGGFALPALLTAPSDVARMSAAMFTISYSEALVVSVLSGAAWDLGGSAALRLPADCDQRAAAVVRAGHDPVPIGRRTLERCRLRAMRTVARRLGFGFLIAAVLFVAAVIVTARRGDSSLWPPQPGAPTTEVFIVSHGYHAGIIVPRRALAEEASRRGLMRSAMSRRALPPSTGSRSAGATKPSTARCRRRRH